MPVLQTYNFWSLVPEVFLVSTLYTFGQFFVSSLRCWYFCSTLFVFWWNSFVTIFQFRRTLAFAFLLTDGRYFDFVHVIFELEGYIVDLVWRCTLIVLRLDCGDFCFHRLDTAGFTNAGALNCTLLNFSRALCLWWRRNRSWDFIPATNSRWFQIWTIVWRSRLTSAMPRFQLTLLREAAWGLYCWRNFSHLIAEFLLKPSRWLYQ